MSSRKRFLDRKEMSPINNDVIGALDFEISIGQLRKSSAFFVYDNFST